MSPKIEFAMFAVILAREKTGKNKLSDFQIVDEAAALRRLAIRYQNLAVALCNGDIEQDRYDAKTKKLAHSISCHAALFGAEPVLGGDPRGCVVKLKLKSGRTNDWGQEGVCVPTN